MFFQQLWELIIHIFVYMNNTYHFYMEDQGKQSLDLKQIKKINVIKRKLFLDFKTAN